ncbi:MAG: hydroxyisourate hydrolase [Devosia sp.]
MAGSGRLTTHVLDTMHGKPASGMRFDLLMLHGDHSHHLLTAVTDGDGRSAGALLEGDHFQPGGYELNFHVGAYFDRMGVDSKNRFLDVVPIRFTITEDAHYHVPLLVSPFAYSTYRGS